LGAETGFLTVISWLHEELAQETRFLKDNLCRNQ